MRIFNVLALFLFLVTAPLVAEQNLLDRQDVRRVMKEMMSQHLEHKQMSGPIIKKSMRLYIDQFDPDRLYLLESEVSPFLKLQSGQLNELLSQYQRGDLSQYERLHEVIQRAILRAQKIRQDLAGDANTLVNKKTQAAMEDPDSKRPFAKNELQLRNRIRDEIIRYFEDEKGIYGPKVVARDPQKTYRKIDRLLRKHEFKYLYTDVEGNRLNQPERENILVIHVLKSLAKSLDSHTKFLNSSEAYDMRLRLEKGFHGIGVVVEERDGRKVITKLIKGGPAEKSGLVEVNDEILQIDGRNMRDGTLDELIDQLRDKKRSRVSLLLERSGQNRVRVNLDRELVAINEGRVDIETEKFGNGIIGKITLHSFYRGKNGITSEKDIRRALKQLQKQGPLRGLVLDLRENSGGFLSEAVKVAGLFITNGVVVVSRYASGEERYYRDMDGKVMFDGPLIVLTSKATASAAEIVAQALQDYGVAVIVGDEQTYGKGTIQSQTFTDNKSTSHFKVTVGKYYTVSGKTPQKYGVKADVVVPSYFTHLDIGEEYLESAMGPDEINAHYQDKLSDIEIGLRPWFMRFYMPTLQEQQSVWNQMLPDLKMNSQYRIQRNREYQEFLGKGDRNWDFNDEERHQAVRDIQMAEAVSIIKDMIMLEPRFEERGGKAVGQRVR